MKIILVPNFYLPQLGGVEIAISNIARQFKLQGHEVTIVTNSSSLKLSKEIEPSGIAVYRMPFLPCRIITGLGYKRAMYSLLRTAFSPLSMLISFFKLLRVITLAKPDVVNLHYIGENRLLCLAAKKCIPFKLVVNIHGEDIERHFERSILGRWLAWRTLRSADRVLSNSNHLLNKAIQICPEVGTKSAVVGNGVNLEELVTATKFEYPMKYILSIGRFFQKKGHDILIRAFQLLRQENPELDLFIAGDGPEFSKCVALTEHLGLSESILFLGEIKPSEIHSLLRGCEIFVLPSRREPFGIVVLEAMAARKPVVATRVGGVVEIITHMKNGLLVQPESPEKLSKAITVLLGNPQLCKTLAENGYRTVRQEFTWDRIAEKYVVQYKLVLNQVPE